MISTHEIIGKAVDYLIHEGGGKISRASLTTHLMNEFMRVANSDASKEEMQQYEAAMRMVMRTDKKPRGW